MQVKPGSRPRTPRNFGLDPTKVVGFCTTAGGASSHVAILARALDIPAVAGIDPLALEIAEGSRVILDGAKGTLRMNVTEEEVERIRRRQAKLQERRAVELAHADERADTVDGHHLEVVANIGGLDDAQAAMTKGAEGVGLLRSDPDPGVVDPCSGCRSEQGACPARELELSMASGSTRGEAPVRWQRYVV